MHGRPTPRTATRLILLLASCAIVAIGLLHDAALPSNALMTDSQSTSPSAVGTGNVSLSLSNGAAAGTWTGAITMKPGDTVYRRLTVSNAGAARLRYAVVATSSSTLSAKLAMTVAAISAGSTCTSTSFATGTVVSGPDLAFGSSTELNVVGDPATGAQPGDRVLDAAAADNLCMKLSFPTGTHLGYSGRGTTASTTFTVSGENA